jgi:hypothetical protein
MKYWQRAMFQADEALGLAEGAIYYRTVGDGSRDPFTNEPALDEQAQLKARAVSARILRARAELAEALVDALALDLKLES